MVVVKWSPCSHSTPTFRVRFPLKSKVYCIFKTNKHYLGSANLSGTFNCIKTSVDASLRKNTKKKKLFKTCLRGPGQGWMVVAMGVESVCKFLDKTTAN